MEVFEAVLSHRYQNDKYYFFTRFLRILMALTVCGACEKTYMETQERCPHCNKTLLEQIAYCEGKLKASKEYRYSYQEGVKDGIELYYKKLFTRFCGLFGWR